MLQAQVNYWNLVETKRHDLATELNAAQTLAESIRHSMATESTEAKRVEEIKRHDFASETLESLSNRAKMLSASAAQEQAKVAAIRAGYDYEVGMGANAIAARNAESNALNAQTNAGRLGLDQEMRPKEMYAGMANTAISSLGHVGSSVINANSKPKQVQRTVYRILD